MPKKLLFSLLVFFTLCTQAQIQRKSIFGKVSHDTIAIKDVHIFNLNSRKGTISNAYGEFLIPVKEQDTLLISDIQYESQRIVINKDHLQNLQLIIVLDQKINELNEVEIKEHDLTGNLTNDAKNTRIENKMNEVLLDPDAWKVDRRIVDDLDAMDREKPLDSRKLTDPTEQATQGNILGLLGGLGLNALISEVSKIGQKKRREKEEKRYYEEQLLAAPNNIRNELGDSFFSETLGIPVQYIDSYLNYSNSKGVFHAYLNGNKIEAIDILIKESKVYLKKLKDEE